MKTLLKRTISILIGGVCAFGVFVGSACKPASIIDDYVKVNPGTLPEKNADEDYSPLTPYSQTVTVKVLGTDFTAIGDIPTSYNGKPSGPANNAFNDAALKYLNVKLEYVSTISGERYSDRLSTLMAAGDLPDVFRVTDPTTFEVMKSSGLIEDLANSYYYLNEQYQSMYSNSLYKPALESCMVEGKLYAFPNVQNPYERAQKFYIRKDWLSSCSLQIPTTWEEVVIAARAFKNNAKTLAESQGLNEKDIIPIGITKEIAAIGNNTAAGIFNLFGALPGAFIQKDGALIDSNTSSEAKRALQELASLYQEGLISKEFYNYTDTKVSNDIIAGKVGIVSGMRHIASYPLQESVSNSSTPGAEWVAIELPSVNGQESYPVVDRVLIEDYNCVRRGYEHPEVLAKLTNLFYDMFYNDSASEIYGSLCEPSGGFFYSWIPTKLWYTPYTTDSYKRVNAVFEELYSAGFRISDQTLTDMADKSFDRKAYYQQMLNGEYGSIFSKLRVRERDNGFRYGYPYMQALKAGKTTAQMTDVERKGYGIYEQAISKTGGDGYVAELSQGNKKALYNEFYGVKTPAQQNYGEYLDSSMKKFYLKVITGETPISQWDSFVADYNKNGGGQVLSHVNQWYKS